MTGFTGFLRVVASFLAVFYSGNSVQLARSAAYSPPIVDVSSVNSSSTIERDGCLTVSLGADAAAECGDLRLAHGLPGVTTLSKERAPTLLYSSGHASPRGTVRANVTLPDGIAGLSRVVATVTVNGQQRAQSVYTGTTWPSASAGRIALDYDALNDPTNVYRYSLSVTAYYGDTPVTSSVSGDLSIVNRKDSYFGAGWWMAGLDKLVVDASGNPVVWIGGDGSVRRYTSAGSGKWSAPAVDRPDTITADGTGFARILPGGGKVRFDSQGRHIATRNRLGYETTFAYDASGRLSTITLPLATSSYVFHYDLGGKLSSIDAPYLAGAVRTTRFFESRARLDSIRDPDTTTVKLAYLNSTSGRVVSRTDRRGAVTLFRYDPAWRIAASRIDVSTTDSIVTKLRAGEDIGIADALGAGVVDTSLAYARIDGPRTDVGDTTLFWLDAFGSPKRIRDALGNESVVSRGDSRFPALVTQMTAANGLVTKAWYSARGNVDSTTVLNPYGDGQNDTTRYGWDNRWDEVASVTLPEGEVTTFAYDTSNGNRLWQQPGPSELRRVCFDYGNTFHLVSAQYVGSATGSCDTQVDSASYDVKGNVASSRTPLGWTTTYEHDDIGRETKTIFPIDSTHSGYSRNVFDVSDRVTQTIAYGPAMPRSVTLVDPEISPSADSITLTNVYDKEGNVVTVKRTRGSAYSQFAEYQSYYAYDSAGRKVSETLQGNVERYKLDAAGNVTQLVTSRNDTTKMSYDVLGRLTTRIVPKVTYVQEDCLGAVPGITCKLPEREVSNGTMCIAADTSLFGYDLMGRMIQADNGSALIRRTYYSNGALKTDSSYVAKYAPPCVSRLPDSLAPFGLHKYGLSFTYDRDGRRKTLNHPTSFPPCAYTCTPEQYAYDLNTGALSSVTDVKGYLHAFTYDNSGKLLSVSAPGGVLDSYAYDTDDNVAHHDVSNSIGGISADSLSYDARGKITRATSSSFGIATITNLYDGLGAVVDEYTESNIEGTTEEMFVVDGLGNRVRRRQLLNGDDGGTDFQHQRLFQYDSFGKLIQMTSPYDPSPAHFAHTEDYTYDPSGNTTLVHILETQTNATPDHVSHKSFYSADNKLRVFNKRIGVGSASDDTQPGKRGTFDEYRYDALGRRVFARSRKVGLNCPSSAVDCAPTATRTIWDGDGILYEIRAPGGEIVVSDTTGGGGGCNPACDLAQNRFLFRADENASGLTMAVDTIPDPAIENDSPNGGPDGLGYGIVAYTYGLNIDEPIAIFRNGSTNQSIADPTVVFPHPGWRGMLSLVTDSAGNRVDCPISGNSCIPIDLPGGNVTTDRGKKVESEPLSWFGSLASSGAEQSGLQYKRNRFYDPKRGQFTQSDPIGLGGGLSLYGFASGDAVNFDDPFGLCCSASEMQQAFAQIGRNMQAVKLPLEIAGTIVVAPLAAGIPGLGGISSEATAIGRSIQGAKNARRIAQKLSNFALSGPTTGDVAVDQTLERINSSSPEFDKDGTIFQNRGNPLPAKSANYYTEWTVETPGAANRGARRIVAGKNGERFLTNDHYKTFTNITPEK
jgi:RHS repeat-associated protein